jgi:anaerobic selenocysteine-containing dehydrogenase
LPVTARDEEPQATTQESMFNYVRYSDGGITRLANVRSEVAILSELGQRLLPDSPVSFAAYGNHEKIRETIARTVPGMQDLGDLEIAKREFHVRGRVLHTPEFKTADGRGHFQVRPLAPQANPAHEFPLMLATVRSEGQFNSIIYEDRDSYRNNVNRRSVLLSPEDMSALKLNPGDAVVVHSRDGVMDDVFAQPFDLPKGSALAYYPEANCLTSTDRDPRSQTPGFKSVAVRVQRALSQQAD